MSPVAPLPCPICHESLLKKIPTCLRDQAPLHTWGVQTGTAPGKLTCRRLSSVPWRSGLEATLGNLP